MNKLYGRGANEQLSGGGYETEYIKKLVQLSDETLGRQIGKTIEHMEGGSFEPPISYLTVLQNSINMNGGLKKKQQSLINQ